VFGVSSVLIRMAQYGWYSGKRGKEEWSHWALNRVKTLLQSYP